VNERRRRDSGGDVPMCASGLAIDDWRVLSVAKTLASTLARLSTGPARTTPNTARKKSANNDTVLENCMAVEGGRKGVVVRGSLEIGCWC
jgi:hypothetical protein